MTAYMILHHPLGNKYCNMEKPSKFLNTIGKVFLAPLSIKTSRILQNLQYFLSYDPQLSAIQNLYYKSCKDL